jgi:excinuclease ABC subunit C
MNESVKEQVSRLPRQPGVYIFKSKEKKVLYVGKARILINRVRSYFSPKHDRRLKALVASIHTIDYIATENEVEALILENNLIKQFNPRYNIKLKDAKSYPMIKLTNEPFPRVFRCREKKNNRDEYFGPFVSMRTVSQLMKIFKQVLQLCTCKQPVRPDNPTSPCLLHHIGMCSAPCAGLISEEDYGRQVQAAREILKGNSSSVKTLLKQKMEDFSEKMLYEDAARIRDQISVLDEYVLQSIEVNEKGSADFIGIFSSNPWNAISLVRQREGKVVGKEAFLVKSTLPDEDILHSFCQAWYLGNHEKPAVIYVDRDSDSFELLTAAIEQRTGHTVKIEKPWFKSDKSILKLANDNAELHYEEKRLKLAKIHSLREVKKALHLNRLPRRIEGFDVATLDGKFNTAALVCFTDGKPDKQEYRQFNIPNQEHPDDYDMMKTVLRRRYKKRLEDNSQLPDLVLIDGGRGQVAVAAAVFNELGLDVPIAGLAKKEERLVLPGKGRGILLPHTSPALQLLVAVRDEAHRFSNSRLKRRVSGSYLKTSLRDIPGVGKERVSLLIKRFKSVKRLKEATMEEISTVEGIGVALAETIYHHLHQ